jgi:hypothetical protein
MPKSSNDRVREVLAEYDETLDPINGVVKKHGMSWTTFRKTLDQDAELQSEYERIQHWRGERYSEEAIVVGTGLDVPKEMVRAREVAAATFERAASRYNRRFNPRSVIEHDLGPNIIGAELTAAALRSPIRNLGTIIDVEHQQISHDATDKQSDATRDQANSITDSGIDDPFAD